MDFSEAEFVNYNGLSMYYGGANILFSGDDGAIIDWLSEFDYPRQILTEDSTHTRVAYRDGEVDLIVISNFMKEGDKGLTVQVLRDFIRYGNDLSNLGRPYEGENEDNYLVLWKTIGKQLQELEKQFNLQPIAFALSDGQSFKPHFRYK